MQIQYCYCDICKLPIKHGELKFIFAVNRVKASEDEEKGYITLEELAQRIRENKKIKTYEICLKCKRVLEHFLNLRVKEVRQIQKELERLEEE